MKLLRIIPARAGPTLRHVSVRIFAPDHPRACGANADDLAVGLRVGGSSPRVRGQRRDGERYSRSCRISSPRVRGQRLEARAGGRLLRIIPARAGPTVCPSRRARWPPDHPRACGANAVDVSFDLGEVGSSPRVRGQRVSAVGDRAGPRIIPARAGPTVVIQLNHRQCADHPRACGANAGACGCLTVSLGSSPRVRGQP